MILCIFTPNRMYCGEQDTVTLWNSSTTNGISLQWTLPIQQVLPWRYTIQRSVTGKNRFITIGSTQRLTENEWRAIILAGNKDSIATVIDVSANRSVQEYERRKAMKKLDEISLLSPQPFLFILGLAYTDTTAKNTLSYDYRIVVDGVPIAQVSNISVTKKNFLEKPPTPISKSSTQSNSLVWSIVSGKTKGIRGYNIYRKADYENTFRRVNTTLVTTIHRNEFGYTYSYFDDCGLLNNIPYHYRISAVDVFGNESVQSESILGIPNDRLPLEIPKIIRTTAIGDSVIVEWSDITDSRISGLNVYRSITGTSLRFKINKTPITPDKRSYTDVPSSQPTDYVSYALTVLDYDGIESRMSFEYTCPVADTYAPEHSGTFQVQNNGTKIFLLWNKVDIDDIVGYELSRSTEKYTHYETINGIIKDTVYNDIVQVRKNSRDNSFWYRLRVVDRRGNISNWSSPIRAIVSDTLSVTPPYLSSRNTSPYIIDLMWVASYQKNIVGYYINRYDNLTTTPTTLTSEPIPASMSSYVDNSVRPGNTYWYEIVSVDSFFNFSPPSNRVALYCGEPFHLRVPLIDGITSSIDGNNIRWRWVNAAPQSGNIYIERSVDGKTFEQCSPLIDNEQTSFTDVSAISGVRYYYRIRYKAINGMVNEPSNSDNIQVQN